MTEPLRGRLQRRLQSFIKWVQNYSDRRWYPDLVGVLAAIDYWILVIPVDGLVISGTMLAPKRWLHYALIVPTLSTVGAMSFAFFITEQGLPYVQTHWADLMASNVWLWTESFFDQYGLLVVFLVAATPLMQQPPIIIAALAGTSYTSLAIAIFAGRLMKYVLLCWLASHAPAALSRLWGLKGEMREAGVEVDPKEKG